MNYWAGVICGMCAATILFLIMMFSVIEQNNELKKEIAELSVKVERHDEIIKFFNSDEPNIRMFNKDTNFKHDDVHIPLWCKFTPTVWVSHDTATEQEKETHKKEIEICGGFLKTLEYKEAWLLAWDKASKKEHKELLDLPNWDNKVFKEITGIDAEYEIKKECGKRSNIYG